MTADVPMLEDSLVWQTTGHLADVAISVLADGEGALLPQRAVHHAVTCRTCSERVGLAALLSLEVADALETAAWTSPTPLVAQPVTTARLAVISKVRAPARPPRARLPVMVPALCIVLTLVAGAPLLATLRTSSPAHVLAKIAHVIAQATLATRAPGLAELSWVAAALLVVAGVLVARSAARGHSHVRAGLP